MTGKTHIVGGVALATAVTSLAGLYQPHSYQELVSYSTLFVGAAAVGSLVPDIDHGNAKASNVNIFTKILSIIVRITCGHRGAIHSPLIMALTSIVLYWFLTWMRFGSAMEITAGYCIGYFSHLLIDMMNASGIPLLFPLVWESKGRPKKFNLLNLREGGLTEFLFWVALVILAGTFMYLVYLKM